MTDPASVPMQGDEGAPDAWLAFEPALLDGLDGLRAGDQVIVLTWLDRARRDVLRVHPRGDVSRAEQGVFSTRSPHRPNPIGLHRVEIASIDRGRVCVRNLEALDGTPIVDVKPCSAATFASGDGGHKGLRTSRRVERMARAIAPVPRVTASRQVRNRGA